MVRKLVSVDGTTGALPDSVKADYDNLPTELAPAGLATTINAAVVSGVAPKLDSAAAATTYIPRTANLGFVAFGDSISTAADMGAGGAGYGGAWPHMAAALSQQRLNFRGNAGVAGNTSAQILARLADVIALKPSVVTVLAGTNDLTGSVTFATWSANIIAIVSGLRNAGIKPVLCTIPPRGNTTYLAKQLVWNHWLSNYARQYGLELVDFFTLLVDPLTGMYKSGYDCGDALHPSQAAHLVMAQAVVSQVSTPAYAPIAATLDAGDVENLFAHPLLAVGTPTPTSWITSGSASADWVEGLVTDSDFKGKAWQVAFTAAASASNFREFKSFTIAPSGAYVAGDQILFCFKSKVTASTGVIPSPTAGLRARLLFAGGTPSSWTPVAALGLASGAALHWFRTTVPTGTTTIQASMLVGTIPIGANFTVLMGEFGLFNLTAMGLAS